MSLSYREVGRVARVNLSGLYRLTIGAFLLSNVITMALEMPFSSMLSLDGNPMQTVIRCLVELLISLVGIVLTVGQDSLHLKIARKESNLPGSTYVFHFFRNHPDRYIISGFLMILLYLACLIPTGIGYLVYRGNTSTINLVILVLLGILSAALMMFVRIRYAFLFYVQLDRQEIRTLEAFRISAGLLNVHWKQLFKIFVSFVGYDLVAAISLGVGLIWVVPYKTQVLTVYYLDLVGELSRESGSSTNYNYEAYV